MEYLSDLEKVKIETFCADKEMFEAVKKVLLQHIYEQGVLKAGAKHNPLKNRAFALVQHATENPLTDEVLGQHVRGIWEGINALETGYTQLQNIKSNKDESLESPYNIAE